jgi:short-subunit dehydrogenase
VIASLADKTAVIAGASGGIGRAIALALAAEKMRLVLIGRDRRRLDAVAQEAGSGTEILAVDLARPDAAAIVAERAGETDVFVWSASAYLSGSHAETAPQQVAGIFENNVQACYRLMRALLPGLVAAQGQAVFINSTQGLQAAGGVGAYAGTQHALRAIADSLRDEVNGQGVRVLSVFAGRTATPMQEGIFADEGRRYTPERLIQPEDIAVMVVAALKLSRTAEVTNLTIRPMKKS